MAARRCSRRDSARHRSPQYVCPRSQGRQTKKILSHEVSRQRRRRRASSEVGFIRPEVRASTTAQGFGRLTLLRSALLPGERDASEPRPLLTVGAHLSYPASSRYRAQPRAFGADDADLSHRLTSKFTPFPESANTGDDGLRLVAEKPAALLLARADRSVGSGLVEDVLTAMENPEATAR